MTERREFEMTQADLDTLLAAMKPVPYGYPLGDKPVFLGGVWFCATCNPAISPDYGREF